MQAMKGIKREGASYCAEETVVGVVNARKKKLRWPDVRARAVSEGERRQRYPFGFGFLGRGLFSLIWAEGFPEALFYLFFIFFLPFPFMFSFSSIDFAF
jgi:hypothetical protein